MEKEQEIALLRAQIDRHMDAGNYYLASRYISLIEDVERDGQDGVPCCSPY
jgi:hypothetical protein